MSIKNRQQTHGNGNLYIFFRPVFRLPVNPSWLRTQDLQNIVFRSPIEDEKP